jgi:hypothetical protein
LGTSGEFYDHRLLNLNELSFIEPVALTAPSVLTKLAPEQDHG